MISRLVANNDRKPNNFLYYLASFGKNYLQSLSTVHELLVNYFQLDVTMIPGENLKARGRSTSALKTWSASESSW
jgi:hypothetical protein